MNYPFLFLFDSEPTAPLLLSFIVQIKYKALSNCHTAEHAYKHMLPIAMQFCRTLKNCLVHWICSRE